MPDYPPRRSPTPSRPSTARPSPTPTAGWRTARAPRRGTGPRRRTRSPAPTSTPCPGASELRRRLDQLLAIGALSVPAPARGRYFYQRRDGRQNQPVLYVREGVDGRRTARSSIPTRSTPAGTVALDWYYPSDDGRLLAYGLSENGSEQSVLHVLDVDTGARSCRPHPPHPGRRPRLAARRDRLLLHPVSRAGRGARGRGALPPRDLLPPPRRRSRLRSAGLQAGARRSTGPASGLSPDGRWLVIGVARTFDQTDLYLQDLRSRHAAGRGGEGPAGVVRGRGGARPALPADQPRCAHLPAVRGRSRAPGAGGLAGDRSAAARRRAGGRAGDRASTWRSAIWSGPRPGCGSPISRAAAGARSLLPTLGSLFGTGARVGRARAVLRVLVLHRPAQRLPDRSRRPATRRSGGGWRRTSIPAGSR